MGIFDNIDGNNGQQQASQFNPQLNAQGQGTPLSNPNSPSYAAGLATMLPNGGPPTAQSQPLNANGFNVSPAMQFSPNLQQMVGGQQAAPGTPAPANGNSAAQLQAPPVAGGNQYPGIGPGGAGMINGQMQYWL